MIFTFTYFLKLRCKFFFGSTVQQQPTPFAEKPKAGNLVELFPEMKMLNYTLDISDTPGAKHPLTRLVGKDGNA